MFLVVAIAIFAAILAAYAWLFYCLGPDDRISAFERDVEAFWSQMDRLRPRHKKPDLRLISKDGETLP